MPPQSRSTSGPAGASVATARSQGSAARPIRPVCRYISMPGGCYAGDRCKFRHSEESTKTPHQEKQTCRYYAAGYCKRGAECWYKHVSDVPQRQTQEAGPSSRASEQNVDLASRRAERDEDEEMSDLDDLACMICYDKPLQYGLLAGCSHIFCLACMRGWRDIKDKEVSMLESGVVKACPVCRVPSRFITPSSQFYPEGHPKKAEMIAAYKASMARVPCRYFARSIHMNPPRPYCPYGRDCFYEHRLPTGELHIFSQGADFYMTVHRERSQRQRRSQLGRNLELLADAVFTAGMAGHRIVDIRRELETEGFWSELFSSFGYDPEIHGPLTDIAGGPLPRPPGPGGRNWEEMNSIRRLLDTLARTLEGVNGDDGDEDELVSSFSFFRALPSASSRSETHRSPNRDRSRTPHAYFGPRPPSPHPVATRSGPASEAGWGNAEDREEEDGAEDEADGGTGEHTTPSVWGRSSSRRSSYYGPRPPSPHPTAARSTPASVHGGDDQSALDDSTDEEDSEESGEEPEAPQDPVEQSGDAEEQPTNEEMRAARVRRFGPIATHVSPAGVVPTPSSAPRVTIGGAESAQVLGAGSRRNSANRESESESSESELSETSDEESEEREEREWGDAPSFSSSLRPRRTVNSATDRPHRSSQTLEHALHLQDDIRGRIRLVPDGAASRPGITIPHFAPSFRATPDSGPAPRSSIISSVSSSAILASASAAGHNGVTHGLGSPPRPPRLPRLSLSEDMRPDWGPSAAQEDALGNLAMPGSASGTGPGGNLASRLISGLFRRDAAQERRSG